MTTLILVPPRTPFSARSAEDEAQTLLNYANNLEELREAEEHIVRWIFRLDRRGPVRTGQIESFWRRWLDKAVLHYRRNYSNLLAFRRPEVLELATRSKTRYECIRMQGGRWNHLR